MFLAYLQGIETTLCIQSCQQYVLFLAYLQGIETPWAASIEKGGLIVSSLPTRD